MRFQGFFTALITPFTITGDLDEKGLRFLIERQKESGASGVVMLGTTGESPTLTHNEKGRVLSIASEYCTSDFPLIVGAGTNSTFHTIELIQEAERIGAHGVLLVNPYYNKPTQKGLYQHFSTIAHATNLPILLYNHPGRTGVNLETETLLHLLDCPNIVGVKEASGDLSQMIEVIVKCKKKRVDFSVLSGDDSLSLPLIAAGGDGLISITGNLIPQQMNDWIQNCRSGHLIEAKKQQDSLLPLFQAMSIETNPIPIKYLMDKRGLPSGHPRLPITVLDEKYHTIVDSACELNDRESSSRNDRHFVGY